MPFVTLKKYPNNLSKSHFKHAQSPKFVNADLNDTPHLTPHDTSKTLCPVFLDTSFYYGYSPRMQRIHKLPVMCLSFNVQKFWKSITRPVKALTKTPLNRSH